MLALEQERAELAKANIEPKDVLIFYLGSMLIFGGFFAGVIFILVGNQHVEPLRWSELADGIRAMAVVVAISLLIDLWSVHRMSVANVQSRVDACMVRWGLFWLLGFLGTIMMAFTGRAATFFGFFAVHKAHVRDLANARRHVRLALDERPRPRNARRVTRETMCTGRPQSSVVLSIRK